MSCYSSSDSLEISLLSTSSSSWSRNALSSADDGVSLPGCRNGSDALCAGGWHSSSIMADNSSDGRRGCRLRGRSWNISLQPVMIHTSINDNDNRPTGDNDDDDGKLDDDDGNDNDAVENTDIDDDNDDNDGDVYTQLTSEAYQKVLCITVPKITL